MSNKPDFVTVGTLAGSIDVRLSYKIVELFSEGLYASPNKAIEELVANSFDAGALRVAIFLPTDFHNQGATIAVLDDGEGMDAEGLRQHWLIGLSNKRSLSKLPKGRYQIGKFGIGKLATYVLAGRLSHISKKGGKFYATSLDYARIDQRTEEGLEPKSPIKITLRELSEVEAIDAMAPWANTEAFGKSGFKLFGKGSSPSWTFAVLSSLKEKVHEIRRGTLEWVLRTAIPLRDDFSVFLDGAKLQPSKIGKGRIKKWVLGKDIKTLSKPAPSDIEVREDKNQAETAETRFGLYHKDLGRITGYAEAYKNLLTGKSEDWGRSHGFFVYVLGRLINVADGHFGIKPDELRHGTFGRIRVVVHMDGLDDFLQSDRERIREGPVLSDAQNILRAIFNVIRTFLDNYDSQEDAGSKLGQKLAGSSASLARRPIIEMARATLEGRFRSQYLALPAGASKTERDNLLDELERRADTPDTFVSNIEFVYDASKDFGIALYDASTGVLRINGFHPFVGAFFDEFTSKTSGLPLELFAMAEVLLEAQLQQAGYNQDQVNRVMSDRDQYLRDVAQGSGRRTALIVSKALQEARNDENQLEIEVVAAFTILGFDAVRDGRKGKADGIARAHLSADSIGNQRRYSVTLEAKSKKKPGKAVATATVNISTIALHRDEYGSEHAIVVAPSFASKLGDKAGIAKQIAKDRHLTKANGQPKTITLITVDDLARLVRLAPVKNLGLSKIRSVFQSCSLPEECMKWVDDLEQTNPKRPPYKEVIDTVHQLQQKYNQAAVQYNGLRVALGMRTPPIDYSTDEELIDLCKAMAGMAAGYIFATNTTVELDQSPENVLAAIESATKAHIEDTQK
jgi:hypothetical protein